jgi:enoyl-CoA hydratase/carnithine racemase
VEKLRALRSIKVALYASFETDFDTALEKEAAVGQTLYGRTAGHEEGFAAFSEKREPNFAGR